MVVMAMAIPAIIIIMAAIASITPANKAFYNRGLFSLFTQFLKRKLDTRRQWKATAKNIGIHSKGLLGAVSKGEDVCNIG